MKVYRYEMPDGGGPFFTLDGIQRRTGVKLPSSDYVSGCDNLDNLDKYFHGIQNIPEECKIVAREIPDELVLRIKTGQVIFPKYLIRR